MQSMASKAVSIELKKLAESHRVGTRPKCKECGMKIRGANHANGSHHKSATR